MKTIKWWKQNGWRFKTEYWDDWRRQLWSNFKFDLESWWFWYSPPWKKTKRCPWCSGCGLIGGDYESEPYECNVCDGKGVVPKRY